MILDVFLSFDNGLMPDSAQENNVTKIVLMKKKGDKENEHTYAHYNKNMNNY